MCLERRKAVAYLISSKWEGLWINLRVKSWIGLASSWFWPRKWLECASGVHGISSKIGCARQVREFNALVASQVANHVAGSADMVEASADRKGVLAWGCNRRQLWLQLWRLGRRWLLTSSLINRTQLGASRATVHRKVQKLAVFARWGSSWFFSSWWGQAIGRPTLARGNADQPKMSRKMAAFLFFFFDTILSRRFLVTARLSTSRTRARWILGVVD